MPRIRKPIPGVDPKLLIKDAAKLMPEPTRRAFLRGGASLGALTLLTGCDIVDGRVGGAGAAQDFALQRRRAGLAVQSQQAGADLSRERDHQAVPVQRLLSGETTRRRSIGGDFKLEVGGLIDNKEPWTLERLYALPQESQITRLICVEGWSAIGKWTGVRLQRIPAPARRRHAREIRLVPVRRGLFQHHRHGDRAASADAAHASSSPTRSCRASTASR